MSAGPNLSQNPRPSSRIPQLKLALPPTVRKQIPLYPYIPRGYSAPSFANDLLTGQTQRIEGRLKAAVDMHLLKETLHHAICHQKYQQQILNAWSIDVCNVCAGAERNSAEQPAGEEAATEAALQGEVRDLDSVEGAADGSGAEEGVVGNGSTEKAPAVRRRQVTFSAVGGRTADPIRDIYLASHGTE